MLAKPKNFLFVGMDGNPIPIFDCNFVLDASRFNEMLEDVQKTLKPYDIKAIIIDYIKDHYGCMLLANLRNMLRYEFNDEMIDEAVAQLEEEGKLNYLVTKVAGDPVWVCVTDFIIENPIETGDIQLTIRTRNDDGRIVKLFNVITSFNKSKDVFGNCIDIIKITVKDIINRISVLATYDMSNALTH